MYELARHFRLASVGQEVSLWVEQARGLECRRRVLDHARQTGNVAKTCRFFDHRPGKFLIAGGKSIRQTYHLGPRWIVWYLARYHDVGISDAGVYRILRRNGMSRLPSKVGRRAVHTTRYEKRVPGHPIQVDVKFLTFKDEDGAPIKRYQYTAIDVTMRIRALKIYEPRHNQANAIDFIDYVIEKFPFRIHLVSGTDRGHEFKAKFHWHVEDLGIRHAYIKSRSPQLNGKVERSHRSDEEEFHQLLTYKNDVDLDAKLAEWERFYNLSRPHGAHKGKTPYEALRDRL